MKRVVLIGLAALGMLSGCSSGEEAEESKETLNQEIQRLDKAVGDRNRTIAELQDRVGELQARLQEIALQEGAEADHTAEQQDGCPAISFTQDPVEEENYKEYQRVETPCYSIYIPKTWSYRALGRELEFVNDRLLVGSTEVLSYMESGAFEHWSGNHTEQIGYRTIADAVPIRGTELNTYQIRLIWTKPAAALDPDWQYDDTRYYFAIKPLDRSFGFYFSTEDVPAKIMTSIMQSFRLRQPQ